MEQRTTAKFLPEKDEHRVLDPKYRLLPNYLTTNIQENFARSSNNILNPANGTVEMLLQ